LYSAPLYDSQVVDEVFGDGPDLMIGLQSTDLIPFEDEILTAQEA
jgi:hypothetical protein